MADLSTTYLGCSVSSPVVVGACSISKQVDRIKEAEEAGAGALVIKSLFQEQLELEEQVFEDALNVGAESFPEALQYFPPLEHAGPKEHLLWVEEARKAVKMPLIGSLNAKSEGTWVDWARQLEETGVNALELNVYSIESDPSVGSADIERRLVDTVGAVKAKVSIPVAVKLGPFYTAMANVARSVDEAGADALVLFNRFYQPEIDIEHEGLKISLDYSSPDETRLPLRWIAILADQVDCELAASTGVHTGDDAARHLLAGAQVVQVVSALYLNSVDFISKINAGLSKWMDGKGYAKVEDFRGKVTQKSLPDPRAFERAQYIKLLLGQD